MKKLSVAELIIIRADYYQLLLASSCVGERISRQLRSEIYIPSEEKTSADGETGRFITLKEVNFTDIDISKHYYS